MQIDFGVPPAQLSPLATALISFAGAILGAAVGGVVTWLTAARKLAREKAFERRMDWHEGMVRALAAALHAIVVAELEVREDRADMPAATVRITEALLEVKRVRADAFLFARPEVILTLEKAFDESFATSTALRDAIIAEPTRMKEHLLALLSGMADSLRVAITDVTHDARAHLGLEPLAEEFRSRMKSVAATPPTQK